MNVTTREFLRHYVIEVGVCGAGSVGEDGFEAVVSKNQVGAVDGHLVDSSIGHNGDFWGEGGRPWERLLCVRNGIYSVGVLCKDRTQGARSMTMDRMTFFLVKACRLLRLYKYIEEEAYNFAAKVQIIFEKESTIHI